MKILILSDIEASGEWLALQTLINYFKRDNPTCEFHLIAFGENRLLLEKQVFKNVSIIKKPIFKRPFKYYRQLIVEFIEAVKTIRKVKQSFQDTKIIMGTHHLLLLSSFVIFPFKPKFFYFQGFRHFYKISPYRFNHYMIIIKLLERLAFLLSNKLIVPSKFALKILKNELGIFAFLKKFYILSNMCRPQFSKKYTQTELQLFRKKYHLNNKVKYIVYAGIIDKRKSIYELIQGYSRLIKHTNKIKLVIAHLSVKLDINYYYKIQRLIQNNKLEKNIIFLRDLDAFDLAKLFRVANLGILPTKFETYSLFTREALESSLPIIATKTGEIGVLLKKFSSELILQNISASGIYNSLIKFFNLSGLEMRDLKKRMKKELYLMHKKTTSVKELEEIFSTTS